MDICSIDKIWKCPYYGGKLYGHPFYEYYWSKGKENRKGKSLEDVYGNVTLSNKFVVQYQAPYKDNIDKRLYGVFDSYLDFYCWLVDNVPQSMWYFHEVIQEGIQKIRFDIDIPKDKCPPEQFTLECAENIINDIIWAYDNLFEKLNICKDLCILSSNGPDKYSYHIIINRYAESSKHVKYICDKIIEMTKVRGEKYSDFIDGQCYNSLQHFRLPFNYKPRSGRKLEFLENWNYNGFNVTHEYIEKPDDELHKILIQFRESLVGYVDTSTCKHNKIDLPEEISQKEKAKIIDKKNLAFDVDSAVDFLADDMNNYTIRCIQGDLIILDRIKPSICMICERVHEKENPYLQILGNKQVVLFHCRRSPGKYKKIGMLKPNAPCDIPLVLNNNNEHIINKDINVTLEYNERYVRPINIPDKCVFMLQSYLGTGKTSAIIKWLKDKSFKRVICLSPRQIFACNLCGELNRAGLQYVNYQDIPYEEKLDDYDKKVMQMESLNKLRDTVLDNPNDCLIIDEVESCLKQFSSTDTMGVRLVDNVNVFEQLIKTTPVIICADAFLGNKSVDVMKCMRDDVIIHKNNYVPEKRTAIKYSSKTHFYNKALETIKEGKNIIMVWTSKTEMFSFKSELEPLGIKHLTYFDKCDDQLKRDLSDVREQWTKVQVVLYTPCITVGVNMDLEHFDQLFVYGSCMSCCVRDTFQATMRARHLKDNIMHYYLYSTYRGSDAPLLTLKVDRILEQSKRKTDYLDKLISNNNFLNNWEEEPNWLALNHLHNILEDNESKILYDTVFNRYLDICGYIKEYDINVKFSSDDKDRVLLDYEEIPSLNPLEFSVISKRIKNKMATEMEKLSVDKYYFDLLLCNNINPTLRSVLYSKYWKDEHKRYVIKNLYIEKNKNLEEVYNLDKLVGYKMLADATSIKYSKIKDVNDLLGLKNSADSKTYTHESFESISKHIVSLSNELIDIFRVKVTASKKSTAKVRAVKILNAMFKSWNDSTISLGNRSRKRVQGGRIEVSNVVKSSPILIVNEKESYNIYDLLYHKKATIPLDNIIKMQHEQIQQYQNKLIANQKDPPNQIDNNKQIIKLNKARMKYDISSENKSYKFVDKGIDQQNLEIPDEDKQKLKILEINKNKTQVDTNIPGGINKQEERIISNESNHQEKQINISSKDDINNNQTKPKLITLKIIKSQPRVNL